MTDLNGLTVKELVLRLDAKIDTYMAAHESRHATEGADSAAARANPQASAAGRAIETQLRTLAEDVSSLQLTVASHERTIQRITGAMIFVTVLGISTLALLVGRLSGIIQ